MLFESVAVNEAHLNAAIKCRSLKTMFKAVYCVYFYSFNVCQVQTTDDTYHTSSSLRALSLAATQL